MKIDRSVRSNGPDTRSLPTPYLTRFTTARVSRRTVLAGIGATALGTMAGCTERVANFVIGSLDDVDVENYRSEPVEAVIEIDDPSGEVILSETVHLEADTDDDSDNQAEWDDVWTGTGEYTVVVETDEETVEETVELETEDQSLLVAIHDLGIAASLVEDLDDFIDHVTQLFGELNLVNEREERVTATVEVTDADGDVRFDESVELAPDESVSWDDVWTDTGEYTLSVETDVGLEYRETFEPESDDDNIVVTIEDDEIDSFSAEEWAEEF